jgi:hypothetical protein
MTPRSFGRGVFGEPVADFLFLVGGVVVHHQMQFPIATPAQGWRFNLGGIVGGAIPPLISGALLAAFGSWSIGLMMAVLVLASLVSTYLLRDTTGAAL